mgnify:CR=1 FL=1
MIKNVTYNTNGAALLPKEQASKVTIENSVINAPTYVVATNNSYLNGTGEGVNIVITGSTLGSQASTVFINANGVNLIIKNSMITGGFMLSASGPDWRRSQTVTSYPIMGHAVSLVGARATMSLPPPCSSETKQAVTVIKGLPRSP